MIVQENGAFDALQQRILQAVQFTIVASPQSPEKVLESYTFTVMYNRDGNDKLQPHGLSAEIPHGGTTEIGTVQRDLSVFVKRVVSICERLPPLPGESAVVSWPIS